MCIADEQRLEESRRYWDQEAATFDNESDHGLRQPAVYAAWEALLVNHMPSPTAKILDIGCGTGSLSVLLSRLGHDVTGIDLSSAMVDKAKQKAEATQQQITFMVMDASHPQFADKTFDVIVCRHILWALPEPDLVLTRWVNLLKPQGRLVLIEGYWHTDAGMHSEQVVNALPTSVSDIQVETLNNQPELWGGEVTDERYLVLANLAEP